MSLLLAASTAPPPPVNDPNATRPFGWVVIKSWDIPDQFDYQRKIRITAEGVTVVTDQPRPQSHAIELQAWNSTDTNYQPRKFIVQDGSASQPPVQRLQRIEQSLWDVPPWPTQPRKGLVPIPAATVTSQPAKRFGWDAYQPWFVLDGTSYQRRPIGLPVDGPTPVIPPTTTTDGGYIWNRFRDDEKSKKTRQVYRPLGDEFLRIQLEQMRLAGLIDENEEEELLVLLIATSMH